MRACFLTILAWMEHAVLTCSMLLSAASSAGRTESAQHAVVLGLDQHSCLMVWLQETERCTWLWLQSMRVFRGLRCRSVLRAEQSQDTQADRRITAMSAMSAGRYIQSSRDSQERHLYVCMLRHAWTPEAQRSKHDA